MPYEIRCYKIWWENNPEAGEYVGSTKETLAKRMTAHRRDVKQGKMRNICEAIRKHGRFQYIMLESCMVNSNDEKRMREQFWIEELEPSLNMIKAFQSSDSRTQYQSAQYQANREERIKKQREYYQANREVRIKKQREYDKDHRLSKLIRDREYHHANREEKNKKRKELYQANKEEISRKNKELYQANKEEINRKAREYRHAKKLKKFNQKSEQKIPVAQ